MADLSKYEYGMTSESKRSLDEAVQNIESAVKIIQEVIDQHVMLLQKLKEMIDDPEVSRKELKAAVENIIDVDLGTEYSLDSEIRNLNYAAASAEDISWDIEDLLDKKMNFQRLEEIVADLPTPIIHDYIDALERKFGPSSSVQPLLEIIHHETVKGEW